VDRHGQGPSTLSALRRLLTDTRQRGYAVEDGEVTPGLASVAVAVADHNQHPVAAVAVTYPDSDDGVDATALAAEVGATAGGITRRIGGHPAQR
jgi:DNA-binding IclR family transcriptional regulator